MKPCLPKGEARRLIASLLVAFGWELVFAGAYAVAEQDDPLRTVWFLTMFAALAYCLRQLTYLFFPATWWWAHSRRSSENETS